MNRLGKMSRRLKIKNNLLNCKFENKVFVVRKCEAMIHTGCTFYIAVLSILIRILYYRRWKSWASIKFWRKKIFHFSESEAKQDVGGTAGGRRGKTRKGKGKGKGKGKELTDVTAGVKWRGALKTITIFNELVMISLDSGPMEITTFGFNHSDGGELWLFFGFAFRPSSPFPGLPFPSLPFPFIKIIDWNDIFTFPNYYY